MMTELSKLPALLQAQDWPRAEALLRKAAQSKSASAEVYYNLAKVLEAAGKSEQRHVWLKRAVAARSDYAIAWYELGRVALGRGDCSSAAQSFDKAFALAPEDADARRMAARLALRQGCGARPQVYSVKQTTSKRAWPAIALQANRAKIQNPCATVC